LAWLEEKRMNSRWFLVMSALFGIACGPSRHNVRDVEGDFSFAERPENGLIIISTRLSSDCKHGEDSLVAIHYVDDSYTLKRTGSIPVGDPFREHDIKDPSGYFSIREVNAGPHAFCRLMPFGSWPENIPFEVKAGKAVYLGELHVHISGCGSGPTKFAINVTDQWERDGRLFQQRLETLRSEDVVKSLLTNPSTANAASNLRCPL
jgi:hypothetical protein